MTNRIKLFKWMLGFVQLCAVLFCVRTGIGEVNMVSPATEYFLEKPPNESELSRIPPTARELIIAKVRIVGPVVYLIGRHQSGEPPPLPKDLFAARVEIVDVIAGRAATGERYDVYFGVPGLAIRRPKYPHTPSQKLRDYFVVSYVEDDNARRLLGVPADDRAYEAWHKEVREYERARARPGARDR